jgi:hypothetical protein
MEEWVEIPNCKGFKINKEGQVKGPRGKIITLSKDNYGYYCFSVRRTVRVHRAVMLSFKGDLKGDNYLVRHLDGNNQNNNIDNLAWGTHLDNTKDSIRHGTHVSVKPDTERIKGSRSEQSKLTEVDVRAIRERAKTETYASIKKDYPVSVTIISKVARRIDWKHVL